MDPQQRTQGGEQGSSYHCCWSSHGSSKENGEPVCARVCVFQPFEVVQTCVSVWLKGAQTSVYRVTLMALVSNT